MREVERAAAIIEDIKVNHLPRVREGLERGYIDENQILVMYDHAVRARILREMAMFDWESRRSEFSRALAVGCPNVESQIEWWERQNPKPL